MNSQTSKPQSRQLSPEAAEELRRQTLGEAASLFSLEQLRILKDLTQGEGWQLLMGSWLHRLEVALTSQVWDLKTSHEKYDFLRGQMHTLNTLKRMPRELDVMIEAQITLKETTTQ